MKNLIYILSVLLLVSCTKELDEDIFDFDIEDLQAIDPETGLPIDEVEIDPETGLPIEDPENPDGEEENPEEVDPELNSDNAVSGWTVLIGGVDLEPTNQQGSGNVVELIYPFGTDISNVTIVFELPDTATIETSTTGLNFNTNDGVKVFNIVAENGDINTFAFGIEVAEE